METIEPSVLVTDKVQLFNCIHLRSKKFIASSALLVLFITEKLKKDENVATTQFHAFTMLVYFANIFGGILSDNWLGKFKTMFYLLLIYCTGIIVLDVAAFPTIGISRENLSYIGLLLMAFGAGGIVPCESAFVGDQFKLPEQANYMTKFFSIYYAIINAAALVSMTVTPMLRAKFKCFGDDDCYSLAFGVSVSFLITGIVLFLSGKKWYTKNKASGNSMFQVFKCIT
ncbi:peptide transporter family 1-like, partial [Contarinia nasturtii]|uniref:peptide transporter family 1-like n=1 Tax=Contarinia nasturtii TaxID=265458 RepID=UPI0012D39FDB